MRDNWEELNIGNEVNIQNGFPFPSSKFNEEGVGVPLIRIRDLLTSSQNTYFEGNYSESYLVNSGDILVGMDGDFHLVKWKNSPSLLNQRILKIGKKKNSKIDTDFIYYYLQPFLLDVHSKTAATTVKHLSSYDISNAVKLLPPIPQQQKIAKILTTCDAVIEKTEAAIAKYQAMKQGLMHDLFTRGIDTSTGKLRPKYEEAKHLYKESELGWIPKDWEVKKLEEITFIIDGDRGNNYPKESDFSDKGFCLFLSAKNVTKQGFSFNEKIFIPKYRDLKMNNGKLERLDIVITTRGTVGNCAIYNEKVVFDHIRINSGMLIIRLFDKTILNNYLFDFFNSNYFNVQLEKVLSGSAQPQITINNIKKFSLPYSSNLDEQTLISGRIGSLNKKIQTEQSSLSKYQQIKTGLMQDLLSGKVEVKV